MTAVTQTEAFAKLDEGTVKDFIMKERRRVALFWYFTSLNSGCPERCIQVLIPLEVDRAHVSSNNTIQPHSSVLLQIVLKIR